MRTDSTCGPGRPTSSPRLGRPLRSSVSWARTPGARFTSWHSGWTRRADRTQCMTDAEQVLRRAKRPLVLGIGGGGDVVGALATAEHARIYDGAEPIVGGVTWERRAIEPRPGPRGAAEVAGGDQIQ